MPIKTLSNPAHQKNTNGGDTLSGRQAADHLLLSDNTFLGAIEHGYLIPQSERPRFRNGRKYIERDFVVAYLDEVLKIIGKNRGEGVPIFTPDVIKSLLVLRKEWDGKVDVDWAKDNRDTERAVNQNKKRKK